MKRHNGIEIWRGPSRLDGSPIVAILTGLVAPSTNRKTGPMAQLYILRADMPPIEAAYNGADAGICGDCPHRMQTRRTKRGRKKRSRKCYVNLGHGPRAVWDAWARGSYAVGMRAVPSVLPPVRLGAYGDPAAVPLRVLRSITRRAPHWTGYTHQWRRFPGLRELCMASTDSAAETRDATARGWRCFHVRPWDADSAGEGSIWCPAAPEGGARVQCIDCGLCAGASRPAKNIAIRAHGPGRKLLTIGGE